MFCFQINVVEGNYKQVNIETIHTAGKHFIAIAYMVCDNEATCLKLLNFPTIF